MFGLSRKTEKSNSTILFYEDHFTTEVSEESVGRKGLSLFKLKDIEVPVPAFFVVTPTIYRDFIFRAFDSKIIDLLEGTKLPDSREIEKIIRQATFTLDFQEELLNNYSRLSGFSNAWVSVRSSIVFPDKKDIPFNGVFDTVLNVRGFEELLEGIKDVYISVFTDRAVDYVRRNGISLADVKMAVVVQKMVQAEVSGVAFTVDPITQDKTKMSIEAVFGLGDVISNGEITPDHYVLAKKDLNIIEKHISPQEWMRIRKVVNRSTRSKMGEVEKVQISSSWSHQQKLEDRYIDEVAKISLIIEDRLGDSQDVEWVWESGNIWVLQNKQMTPKNNNVLEFAKNTDGSELLNAAVDIVKVAKQEIELENAKDEIERKVMDDATKVVEKNKDKQAVITTIDELIETHGTANPEKSKAEGKRSILDMFKSKPQSPSKPKKEEPIQVNDVDLEFVISGIGASYGAAVGMVKVIESPVPKDIAVGKNDVLLIKKFTKDMEPLIFSVGAVIMDEGGLTSDVAMMCRELRVPAVVGTGLGSVLLKDGDIVKIDGNVGSIYRSVNVKAQPAAAMPVEPIKTEVPVEDNISVEKDIPSAELFDDVVVAEEAPVKKGSTLKMPTATKVYTDYSFSDGFEENAQSDGLFCLDLDALMLSKKRHPMAFVEDKTFKGYANEILTYLDKVADSASGNEVVIAIGSANAADYRGLVKGSKFVDSSIPDNMYGASLYLKNEKLLDKVLKMVKDLRNVMHNRNISLAIHGPVNGELMLAIKKEISTSGLRRTSTFNVYAILDSATEVLLCDEILSADIDGVIVNAPRIAMQIEGMAFGVEEIKSHLGSSSVLKMIETVKGSVKSAQRRMVVMSGDSKELIRKCVEAGVYGISVSAGFLSDARKTVGEAEAKMVLRNMR